MKNSTFKIYKVKHLETKLAGVFAMLKTRVFLTLKTIHDKNSSNQPFGKL